MRARTAWWVAICAAVGSVALIGAALVLAYVDRYLVPARLLAWDFPDVFGQLVDVAAPVVGFVLASRRPANPIGWLFLVGGLALGLGSFSTQYGLHVLVVAPGSLPAGRVAAWLSNWIWVIPWAMLTLLFLLFPTGRLRSRRWHPAAWFIAVAFALITVGALVLATQHWPDPFSVPGSPPLLAAMYWLLLAALVVGVAAVVTRFVRSAGEERLQLKWFAAAAVLVVATMIGSFAASTAVTSVLQNLAVLCLWVAIGVAVLKYRLYDIDRIISRTLAYAIVTGLLVGLYAGLVVLATRVLTFHTPVAVAASTLAAVALFSPLRRRVQRAVDRRFNRARYDADKTVAAFAARLKDAVELDAVQDDLAGVVHQALAPAHVSVWLSRSR
jgi:hypothetical protein